jgi:hypothetical protein
MAKLSTKHERQTQLSFTDFSGGLNLITPVELINNNEMQDATNFEFNANSGQFKVRGGLTAVTSFNAPIQDIIPAAGDKVALVKSAGQLFRLEGVDVVLLGDVEGDAAATYTYWGEAADILCAFGGPIYFYDAAARTLTKVESEGAPTRVITLYYRVGRLAIAEAETDVIRYSGVGDYTQWVEDPDDDSTSKQVEIGYKDGRDITAVGELGGDLLVFKAVPGQPEYGNVYRLSGEFPNWAIELYSSGLGAWSPGAVARLGNDLLFVTKEGVASLQTSQAFGSFKQAWPGAKINPRLALTLTAATRLWLMASRGQVWVWDGVSSIVYVYHYQIGEGAWTRLSLPAGFSAAAIVTGTLYVAVGNTVYMVLDTVRQDELIRSGIPEPSPIQARWAGRSVQSANNILIKKVAVQYSAAYDNANLARVNIEGFIVELPSTEQSTGDIAFLDTDIAFLDEDQLVSNAASMIVKRCQFTRRRVTPVVSAVSGAMALNSVICDIVEVQL